MEVAPLQIYNVLWLTRKDRRGVTNPIVKHSLSIWDTTRTVGGLQSTHNPMLQVLHNPPFPPGMDNSHSFCLWKERDLTSIHKLTTATGMKSFPNFQAAHNLPGSELFRYLQLKGYAERIALPRDSTNPMLTWLKRQCRNHPHARGLITGIYNDLLLVSAPTVPQYGKSLAGRSRMGTLRGGVEANMGVG